jgi:hypothetical protein
MRFSPSVIGFAGVIALTSAVCLGKTRELDQNDSSQAAPAGATSGDEDAGGQRSRKRAASGRPQDERLAAVQEKNRKAQKRFRERQKVCPSSCAAVLRCCLSVVTLHGSQPDLLHQKLEKVVLDDTVCACSACTPTVHNAPVSMLNAALPCRFLASQRCCISAAGA